MPTALKVAAVVGSLLFTIDQGGALVQRKMTGDRWI
ncbi:MAG: nitrate/nitrite transporter NrtS [Hormoscilla sp. GUM202]|nr:nitrate/nitrite transporter NrtS [Hormoscilla sp. GUM202]